ncbi:MAG: replicative DNA helicase [Longimicrobiaceae bacterium]
MSTPALHLTPPSAPSPFTDRTPPYSAEAEMAVLGGMLIDQDAVVKAVEVVDDTMFHREAHRRLFRSLLRIWQRGDVIDEITVSEDLRKAGDFEAVGGVTFLASLLDAVPTAANIEYHCKIVREKAILRRLIEAATSIIQETYAWQGEVENLMDVAEQRIFQLAQSSDRRGFVWIKEILWPTFEKIEQLQANQSSITGVPTGFADLDELTAGFQPSDLVIIAARPSMGKCLAHDAEIVLDDGSIATIEELYRRRSARLLTLNERWKLETAEPSAYVDDGEKPVFRVTTRLGRQIETTLTHPFLTIGGWKRLEEIQPGEHVAVPRRIDVFGDAEMRECEVKLLACLIGDGDLKGPVPRLRTQDPEVRAEFTEAALDFFADGLHRGSSLAAWAERFGLAAPDDAEAVFPDAVFTLPREQLALFLNRFLSVAGGAFVGKNGGPLVRVERRSERFIRHLQHLLLRFGVLAEVRPVRREGRAAWMLEISELDALVEFNARIGLFGLDGFLRRHTQAAVRELALVGARASFDAIPAPVWEPASAERGPDAAGGEEFAFVWRGALERSRGRALSRSDLTHLAAMLDNDRLRDLAESDVYWDEVVSIEPMGIKQVYDLTIPGTHNFVANDVCVHNTAFVLNLSQHAAIQAQRPVAFFSLEMSKESLVQRVLCAEARVDASRLRRGRLTDDDYARLAIAAGHLNTAPIYIDDTPGISVLEMRAKARRLKADRADLAMIVVDYLQLMVSHGKSESRQQEVSEISRGLKALAKELEIPVVALSQLSRAVESRPDKRPMMSDLRESGAIEQDADVIMFLYRPEYYFGPTDKEGNSIEGKAELIIGKQRNGATGNVPLFFRKEFTLFESMTHHSREDH